MYNYADGEMSLFEGAIARQFSNSEAVYLNNLEKSYMDKFISDFSGDSKSPYSSKTLIEFRESFRTRGEKRLSVMVPLMDYIHRIDESQSLTFGLNLYAQNPCTEIENIDINLYNMTKSFIPKDFCESSADG